MRSFQERTHETEINKTDNRQRSVV